MEQQPMVRKHVMLPRDLLERLRRWRRAQGIDSDSEAIRTLLERALKEPRDA